MLSFLKALAAITCSSDVTAALLREQEIKVLYEIKSTKIIEDVCAHGGLIMFLVPLGEFSLSNARDTPLHTQKASTP